ncbi:hypothetical protein ACH5RR_024710 [Cinchona calisaya]|uniref:Uncharacterized protein n=1 Tax=Cinchona calisaya TaxID=153742 RepID=A0ABD2YXI7_9GENT
MLVLYGSSFDEAHELESKDPNVSKHPLVAQEMQGTNDSGIVNPNTVGGGVEHLEEKARRGRGSSGGANVVHHPTPVRAAASVLESPFVFISTTNICISLNLLLVLPHLIA